MARCDLVEGFVQPHARNDLRVHKVGNMSRKNSCFSRREFEIIRAPTSGNFRQPDLTITAGRTHLSADLLYFTLN